MTTSQIVNELLKRAGLKYRVTAFGDVHNDCRMIEAEMAITPSPQERIEELERKLKS